MDYRTFSNFFDVFRVNIDLYQIDDNSNFDKIIITLLLCIISFCRNCFLIFRIDIMSYEITSFSSSLRVINKPVIAV